MATDLERLVVSLSADIKSYERALAKAQGVTTSALRKIEASSAKSLGRIEKSFAKAGNFIAGFGKGLVLGGIATAVAGLTAIIGASVKTAAAVGDLADRLGITTDKLQELQYGAVQAGLDFEGMEKGLLRFSKALGEAQNGSGELLKILRANGFNDAQIKALSYGQALDITADFIKNAKNQQDALLVSTASFGRGQADEFLEFLANGKRGLNEYGKSAKAAGDIIDEELVRSAQVLDDAWAAAMNSMTKQTAKFILNAVSGFQKIKGLFENGLFDSSGIQDGGGFVRGSSRPAKRPKPLSASPPTNFGGSGGFLQAPTTVVPNPEEDAAKKKRIDDATKAYDAQQAAIRRVIEALKFEADQLVASDLQQQINNEHRKAGVSATSAQGREITALVTKNFELARSIEEAEAAGEKFLKNQAELKELMDEFGQTSLDAFESIISGGEKASDVLKKLAIEFIKTAIKARALGGITGGASGGGGSFLGDFIGSLFGGGAPKLYAKGGQIPSGQFGITGEAGPELIQGPANVIPFNKLRGGASGYAKVTVNNYGAQVQSATRTDSSGRKELVLMVKQQVQEETSNPYSRTSAALSARGARPALKQR